MRREQMTGLPWMRRWTVLLLLLVVGGLILFLPLPAPLAGAAGAAERTVRIEAGQFQYDPGVVSVNTGERVTLEVVATDVVHGLYLDGYDLQVTADPGQTARLTFVANRPGTFRFRCSVSCGALHPFMIGKLRVGHSYDNNHLLWRGVGLALLAAIAGVGLSGVKRDSEI